MLSYRTSPSQCRFTYHYNCYYAAKVPESAVALYVGMALGVSFSLYIRIGAKFQNIFVTILRVSCVKRRFLLEMVELATKNSYRSGLPAGNAVPAQR